MDCFLHRGWRSLIHWWRATLWIHHSHTDRRAADCMRRNITNPRIAGDILNKMTDDKVHDLCQLLQKLQIYGRHAVDFLEHCDRCQYPRSLSTSADLNQNKSQIKAIMFIESSSREFVAGSYLPCNQRSSWTWNTLQQNHNINPKETIRYW